MKKIFVFAIIAGLLAIAQYPYYYSIFVKTKAFFMEDAEASFRDTGIYLKSSTDGQLDIVSDNEVELTATTFDVHAAAQIYGDVTISGNLIAESNFTVVDFLNGGSLLRGTGTFTTTAEVDTTLISSLLATDIVVVSGVYVAGVDQQDVLQAEVKADTLIVHRLAAGESAGAYSYIIIR